jgi:hypothetical protein
LFETSLAEHSNRNNGAASTEDRDERDCPDGIAEQCRTDPHAHSHDEHAQSVVLPALAERLFAMYIDPAKHAAITGAPVIGSEVEAWRVRTRLCGGGSRVRTLGSALGTHRLGTAFCRSQSRDSRGDGNA